RGRAEAGVGAADATCVRGARCATPHPARVSRCSTASDLSFRPALWRKVRHRSSVARQETALTPPILLGTSPAFAAAAVGHPPTGRSDMSRLSRILLLTLAAAFVLAHPTLVLAGPAGSASWRFVNPAVPSSTMDFTVDID